MAARALTALVSFAIVALAATPVTAQPSTEPVATNLAFPTNMAFALDGRIFFTEKETGDVRIIRDGRVLPEPFVHISVEGSSERGLLGIALDPNFERQPWVYLYYSEAGGASNRIIRVRAEGDSAGEIDPLITLLPAVAGYHNGGDMAFGPDGKLYAVTGEAHDPERAQGPNDLGGKVLRLDPDGSVPDDNPLGPDNPVYALGIRNSFGLCFDPATGQHVGDRERTGHRRRGQPDRRGRELRVARSAGAGRGAGIRGPDPGLSRRDRADGVRRLGRRTAAVLRELPRRAL
jgi:glucose/arabinose dehydrogenase